MPKTTSYQLNDHFQAYIGAQVASGRYKSASEVMTDALRLHEEKAAVHQAFLDAVDKGMEGPFSPFDAKSFNEKMRAKYEEYAEIGE